MQLALAYELHSILRVTEPIRDRGVPGIHQIDLVRRRGRRLLGADVVVAREVKVEVALKLDARLHRLEKLPHALDQLHHLGELPDLVALLEVPPVLVDAVLEHPLVARAGPALVLLAGERGAPLLMLGLIAIGSRCRLLLVRARGRSHRICFSCHCCRGHRRLSAGFCT